MLSIVCIMWKISSIFLWTESYYYFMQQQGVMPLDQIFCILNFKQNLKQKPYLHYNNSWLKVILKFCFAEIWKLHFDFWTSYLCTLECLIDVAPANWFFNFFPPRTFLFQPLPPFPAYWLLEKLSNTDNVFEAIYLCLLFCDLEKAVTRL